MADAAAHAKEAPPLPRERVRSIDRALDILEAISVGGALGVTEVAARTGLVASTAHRLMGTLVDRGYVSQEAASGRYALGTRLLELVQTLDLRTATLRAAARSHLERIRDVTSETTQLVVLDGQRVVYVDQVEGRHSVRMLTKMGSSIPAHASAGGKAILAHQPPATRARALPPAHEPYARLTPRTLTTLAELEKDFAQTRRRGWSLANEERELGVSCIAAVIFDVAGAPCAAISLSAPTPRVIDGETAKLGALLHRHARGISAVLAQTPVSETASA